MSRRKGLSANEKRERMMQIFYERKDFFQLKELEKIAPKDKGIISQSVKEVVQSLVDDSLVDTEKIGTCVYFWALPSKATSNRKRKQSEISSQLEEVKKKKKVALDQVEKAQVGREDSDGRTAILQQLVDKNQEKERLLKEIQLYSDNDPEVLEAMRKESVVAKDAANRWTDNIMAIKAWCKKKFFIEEATMNKQFGIPEDLDNI